MSPLLKRLSLCVCVLQICVTVIQGETVDQPSELALRSVEDEETILPCSYKPSEGDMFVQVTWSKVNSDGTTEQIITAHETNGQTAFGTWSQRVRFLSQPTVNSSIVIMGTRVSDEGDYLCRIATFPSGNFDVKMSLTVWTVPISSVDPVVVVEGDAYRQVASCRSVGRPSPQLSWDTELNGRAVNRSSANGAVSTQFHLNPRRGMNGKKLDCLVWHPIFPAPRRITNQLVVHYPPHVEISGHNKNWHVGKENAALTCESGGNPKPTLTWSRIGGKLPEGVQASDETLDFMRPLKFSDRGTYQCVAKNEVGEERAEVEVTLGEPPVTPKPINHTTIISLGGGAALLLVSMTILIITLTCYQKRKNKKLKKELSETKEEINTLCRQASFRRVNSVSTDVREVVQTEENLPLRVEGTLRTSLSSLGEQAHCRDSRSTISGGRERGGAFDSLGRPSLHNSSRRGRDRLPDRDEETRLRVESYLRNSTRALESPYHPPLTQSPFPPARSNAVFRQMNGNAKMPADGVSRPGSVTKSCQHPAVSSTYPTVTYDEDEVDEGLGGPSNHEHPDDQDSVSSRLSNLSKLRNSPCMISPHEGMIHKAQIV